MCAGEVCKRLAAAGVQGRTLTLKLKRRKAGAPEPPKFMGHGSCDNLSRSLTLPHFTAAEGDVAAAARSLLRALRVPAPEIRGIGITASARSMPCADGLIEQFQHQPKFFSMSLLGCQSLHAPARVLLAVELMPAPLRDAWLCRTHLRRPPSLRLCTPLLQPLVLWMHSAGCKAGQRPDSQCSPPQLPHARQGRCTPPNALPCRPPHPL